MINNRVKIAFVGNFEYNCGSSNTLLGYIRIGKTLGYDVRASEFGYVDKIIRTKIPVASRKWNPDLLVVVYESYPFLSDEDIEQIKDSIPRKKRVLIDPDGKYLSPRSAEDDSNHPTEGSYAFWSNLYDSLSDVILLPFLKVNKSRHNVHSFLYFGIDNTIPDYSNVKKDFDLIYVGNNWYRWKDIELIVSGISSIRDYVKHIGLIGMYWDEVKEGNEKATYSNSDFLEKNSIKLYKSVPYGQVEKTMSKGLLNPIFVRPILNELNLVTPRMFETFAADTIPLLPNYFKNAPQLYGESAEVLFLSDNIAERISTILQNYNKYKNLVIKIRNNLVSRHSYEARLKELLSFT